MLFGSAPISVAQLVAAVRSGFVFRVPGSDQTSLVKATLEKMGIARGYSVLTSPPGRRPGHPEWLLDVVWWELGRGTVLAAECQWGDAGDILRGFEKLMATKAPLKLMVCRSSRAGAEKQDILFRTDTEAILQALGTSLIDFTQHVAGETYVLMEHAEEESTFRTYEFHVPADGKLAAKFKDATKLFRPFAAEGVSAA